MKLFFKMLFGVPWRFHLLGSVAIVLLLVASIGAQVVDRHSFAGSELLADVMDRWGTPIRQASPSVRYVQSGAVFNALEAMPLTSQKISLSADMNYRKRGLIYFSGFDFAFRGDYGIKNPEPYDVEVVFVFPLGVRKNQVLLSQLRFSVGGVPAAIALDDGDDKLVWTGHLAEGASLAFSISYQGRGLDSFTYQLDPALPVRDLRMDLVIRGGANFDYPEGVIPASGVQREGEVVSLAWTFPSLESGVPMGVILPSERCFDDIIGTMLRRTWAPFILFYLGVITLCLLEGRRLRTYEGYLLAASYGFFYVLLAYLAAFMNFYVAYGVATAVIMGLLGLYLWRTVSRRAGAYGLMLLLAFLMTPTMAVILQGYTGLIYTIEILIGLAVVMALTSRSRFHTLIEELKESFRSKPQGEPHATA